MAFSFFIFFEFSYIHEPFHWLDPIDFFKAISSIFIFSEQRSDEHMDSNSAKPNKYNEFARHSRNWTLKQDIELKDALRDSVSAMLGSLEKFDSMGNSLDRDMELLEIRLANIHNRIGCVKMERLVVEQVDDIAADILLDKRKNKIDSTQKSSRAEYEKRTIATISNAIRRGFELLDSVQANQKPETSGLADPLDPSSSNSPIPSIPKNTTKKSWFSEMEGNIGKLPPIIGSAQFWDELRKKKEEEVKVRTEEGQKRHEERQQEKSKDTSGKEIRTTSTRPVAEEEDVASISSGRSAPPQDPIVAEKSSLGGATSTADGGLRAALMEEIVERGKQKGEQGTSQKIGIDQHFDHSPAPIPFVQQQINKQTELKKPMNPSYQPFVPKPSSPAPSLQSQTSISVIQPSETRISTPQKPTEQPKKKVRIERRVKKKSLFSSSSSESEESEAEERKKKELFFKKPPQKSAKEVKQIGKKEEEEEEEKQGSIEKPKVKEHHHHLATPAVEKAKAAESYQKEDQAVPEEEEEAEQDEMPKPVFKPFDSTFSDRLTAVIQNGPVAFRSDRGLSRRPLSAHSIPTSEDEVVNQQQERPKSLHKTESAISSNEELGPATVKARIAQIGAQIPIGGRRGGGEVERRAEAEEPKAEESAKAPLPTETIKARAKGPARRAPTQLMKCIAPTPPAANETAQLPQPQRQEMPRSTDAEAKLEEEKEKLPTKTRIDIPPPPKAKATVPEAKMSSSSSSKLPPPPPVKQKQQQHRSIFSSSSSDDELGLGKNRLVAGGGGGNMRKPMISGSATLPMAMKKEQSKEKPEEAHKKIAPPPPVKTRKGLFDDSESDF